MIDDPEQNKTVIEKLKIQLKNIYFVNIGSAQLQTSANVKPWNAYFRYC